MWRFESASCNLNAPWASQMGLAPDDRDPLVRICLDLFGIVKVADHVIAIGSDLRPVDRRLGYPSRMTCFSRRRRWADQCLGRDARPVSTFPTDQLTLNHRHPHSSMVQAVRGGLASRTCTDHDHIKVFAHILPFSFSCTERAAAMFGVPAPSRVSPPCESRSEHHTT